MTTVNITHATGNGLAVVAFAFGIAATYAILQYSINNLDVLGLAPEIKKVCEE